MADSDLKPPVPPEQQSAIDAVEDCLRQGEPLLAYNAVQEGLKAFPANQRLRQLRGLALARSGDTGRANQMLSQLVEEGLADAETLGMLARTHKDLALHTREAVARAAHLASAFQIYRQAYEAAGLDLLLLQMSPQYEEMERFAEAVIAA